MAKSILQAASFDATESHTTMCVKRIGRPGGAANTACPTPRNTPSSEVASVAADLFASASNSVGTAVSTPKANKVATCC